MIEVVGFDVFNTVIDVAPLGKEELSRYGSHIRKPFYEPLGMGKEWELLWAWPSAKDNIDLLRDKYTVVTCSNGPLKTLINLSKINDITWDAIIPVAEIAHCFKPNRDAYRVVLDLMRIKPNEMLMVTANKTFGDLEAAKELGINSVLIGEDSNIKNLSELRFWLDSMECVFAEHPDFVYNYPCQ